MYSTHNEGKSVVPQRFIKTLNNKIYKYMTFIYKSDDIVDKYKTNIEQLQLSLLT